MPLDFSLRFCIVLGAVLVPIWPPKWCPRGATKLGFGGPLGVQDGLEIVLVRCSCHLVVWGRFFLKFSNFEILGLRPAEEMPKLILSEAQKVIYFW